MGTHSKDELKVLALKERIGKVVSDYEEQLADFRADATMAIEDLNRQIAELQEEVESCRSAADNAKAAK